MTAKIKNRGRENMFGKKRKKALFGANIELNCRYCRHNGAKQGDKPFCTLRLEVKDGKCKKYEYDPLMREPQYNEEDFKL